METDSISSKLKTTPKAEIERERERGRGGGGERQRGEKGRE